MKAIAAAACYTLAGWIYDGCSFAWPLADAIERRWRIQGATDWYIRNWTTQHEQWQADRRRTLDRRHPDRLTYLHR